MNKGKAAELIRAKESNVPFGGWVFTLLTGPARKWSSGAPGFMVHPQHNGNTKEPAPSVYSRLLDKAEFALTGGVHHLFYSFMSFR